MQKKCSMRCKASEIHFLIPKKLSVIKVVLLSPGVKIAVTDEEAAQENSGGLGNFFSSSKYLKCYILCLGCSLGDGVQ